MRHDDEEPDWAADVADTDPAPPSIEEEERRNAARALNKAAGRKAAEKLKAAVDALLARGQHP